MTGVWAMLMESNLPTSQAGTLGPEGSGPPRAHGQLTARAETKNSAPFSGPSLPCAARL